MAVICFCSFGYLQTTEAEKCWYSGQTESEYVTEAIKRVGVCVHAHNSVRGAKPGQTRLIEMSILKPPKFLISPTLRQPRCFKTVKSIFHKAEERARKKKGPATVTCMLARANTLARLSGKLDLKADNF